MRLVLSAVLMVCTLSAAAEEIPNQLIDYDSFQQNVIRVGQLREQRRVTERQFIRMAHDADTIVLDARSVERFAMLHVKGARNLSLPDMTAEELAKVIPSKSTRILIYCNNNFLNAPAASLNLSTYIALYSYGYRNVYELGPLIDVAQARLPLEGSDSFRE